MKPFKAWLVFDAAGTYVPSMHMTRRDAKEHASGWNYLRDGKWRVVRVKVNAIPSTRSHKP